MVTTIVKECEIMIFDAILGFICSIPNAIFNSMDSIDSLTIPDGAFDWWENVFTTLSYVFPVYALIPILIISFIIKFWEIGWSGFNRIKGIFWASS